MTADAVGGVWTYALDLARELASRGHATVLATMGPRPDAEQRLAARAIPRLELRESDFRLEWQEDSWDDVARAGDWLLDLSQGCDAVHLNGFAHADLPWDAPTLAVAHSDVLSWHRAVRGEPAPPEWDRYREAVRRGMEAAGTLVAPTHAVAGDLRREHGLSRRVEVVPNFRPAGLYAPGIKEPFILGAGRLWDEAKNVGALARVAPGLPCPVRVAGEGGEGTPNVEPLGRLSSEALRDQFARAAIFAHPARYEPFGLAVLEAALSGCALVLGDIPSLRENWEGAALFADPDDDNALRAAIVRQLESPILATERAREFTAARAADAYLSLYRAPAPV